MQNSTRTTLQEVFFDLCDMAQEKRLPPEFRSWKEFFTEQADKLASVERSIFGTEGKK